MIEHPTRPYPLQGTEAAPGALACRLAAKAQFQHLRPRTSRPIRPGRLSGPIGEETKGEDEDVPWLRSADRERRPLGRV